MVPMDPFVIGVLVVLAAFLAAVGLARRDRLTVIALTVLGYVIAMLGLAWTMRLSDEATYAALAVGFGATLATMGTERSRRGRSPGQTDAAPPALEATSSRGR